MGARLFISTLMLVWILLACHACRSGNAMACDASDPRANGEEKGPFRTTVLYDNYVFDEGTRAEWGFACLIETEDAAILFDTGGDPDVLMENVAALGVDLSRLDAVVISHDHWDHTGGLLAVLEACPGLPVYILESFPDDFVNRVEGAGGRAIRVFEGVELFPGVHSTGEMGTAIKEQSLILDTEGGTVIVTGCSHQGIVAVLARARAVLSGEIDFVFGGFHLLQHSDAQVTGIIESFRNLGVRRCGATHCTGDRQIELFREAFGDDYVPVGTGRVFAF